MVRYRVGIPNSASIPNLVVPVCYQSCDRGFVIAA